MRPSKLIVFTRYPESGKVKTRLIPALGADGAASLHKNMTSLTMTWARSLAAKKFVEIEVRYDGGTQAQMESWLGVDIMSVSQGNGDLGARMAQAFHDNFRSGGGPAVLIGTDCPQLTLFHVQEAFEALKSNDMVIGPSEDGGYYLIGLKRDTPELFRSIAWGTNEVLQKTLDRAREKNLSVYSLNVLSDVDVPLDLPIWERTAQQYLSIIIPTLNEEDYLLETLECLNPDWTGEVIVVDGGSQDKTVQIAREWGAEVHVSKPCRGSQMNIGAQKASGDILLFLHADTHLPQGFAQLIRQQMANPDVPGGSFALRFHPSRWLLNIDSKGIAFRTRFLQEPYGDQAIFVKASLFHLMSGYAEIPLMEDMEFVRRLNKRGRMAYIREPVVTSSRRYSRHGGVRVISRNKLVKIGFALGVSPERLARFYNKLPSKKTSKEK
ncbi:TIGR04283 family arsenosugar biosynthesis glycosyltransferase [Acidobacteriota bacterium]